MQNPAQTRYYSFPRIQSRSSFSLGRSLPRRLPPAVSFTQISSRKLTINFPLNYHDNARSSRCWNWPLMANLKGLDWLKWLQVIYSHHLRLISFRGGLDVDQIKPWWMRSLLDSMLTLDSVRHQRSAYSCDFLTGISSSISLWRVQPIEGLLLNEKG